MASAYVVYKKTSNSRYYLVGIESNDSVTAIAELTELYGYTLVRILVDSSNNIYVLREKEATLTYTWYKYNSSGALQTSKVLTSTTELFGFIAANGYLYTMKFNGDKLYKRNLSDLEVAETINLTSAHRYYYLCFDSSGYLYTYDRDFTGGAAFVKWELGNAVIESHIQSLASLSAWSDWSLLGSNIACDYATMWTINTALDTNLVGWTLNDIPSNTISGSAASQTYWYVLGENTADNALIAEKYNSSKVLQSTITISTDYISGNNLRFVSAITAYPYVLTTLTTITPILVEDGRATLLMSLDDKAGLTIADVGWYCDETATPSTSFTFPRTLWGLPADLLVGTYPHFVKTLITGQTTLYTQAWAQDSASNVYTGSIISFAVPLPENAEYMELPDLIFPSFFAYLPDFDINLDIYLDKDKEKENIDDLRRKCIRYENAYTDMCLVLNHNTKLIKNWLQSVYNNGTYYGENELFAKIHPSQQLARLELDTLESNDFKEIIDRFTNNNTANASALNHNFSLFREWVNDYNYGSDGYKATYLSPREKMIENDKPTVDFMKGKVDRLSGEISNMGSSIVHNFNLMRELIE